MTLTVACVKWGTKYPAKYVNVLQAMVKRSLARDHEFVCFTDDPKGLKCETVKLPGDLKGWWNKLFLFKPGLFSGRVLFLDLDVCITGPLDDLVDYATPFAIIEDWHLPGYNSSVFVMDHDAHPQVWEEFEPRVAKRLHGDQDWITEKIPNAAIFPWPWCVSYRSHAVPGVPKGARVVVFHGEPKPHAMPSPWVERYWHE
jgi:hypothetical protein